MTSSDEIEATIERYIRNRFRVTDDDEQFDRDVNMWEEGYVDSVGVVEMIAFLEKTFEIVVPEAALFDPDFTSIRGIGRTVMHELSARAQAS